MIGISRNRWINYIKNNVLGRSDFRYTVIVKKDIVEVYDEYLRRVVYSSNKISNVLNRIINSNTKIKIVSSDNKPITKEVEDEICIENVTNLEIIGDNNVTFKAKDGSAINIMSIINSRYVKVRGLSFDGNLTNVDYKTAEMYEQLNNLLVRNSEYIVIKDNYSAKSYYFTFRVENSSLIGIENNISYGFRDQGISVYKSKDVEVFNNFVSNDDTGKGYIGIDVWLSKDVYVVRNNVTNIGYMEGFGHGIDCEGSSNVYILDNVVKYNKVNGICAYEWGGVKPDNITIAFNIVVGNGLEYGGNGITAEDSDTVTVVNNIVLNNKRGIYFKNLNNVKIHDNIVSNTINQGIMAENSTNIDIIGNHSSGSNGNEGIIVLSSKLIRILNNMSTNNKSNGIDIRNSTYGIISNNISINNDWNGFYLDNSSFITVDKNIAYDDRETKDQDFGIMETNYSDYNIIKDNVFINNLNGNYNIGGEHTYCDKKIYSLLPTDGFSIEYKPILYYDGTTYYLAVWNGQSWIKVALS